MALTEINPLVALIAAAGYTLLLLYAFTRREQQQRQSRALFAFLAVSVLWEFLVFFSREIPYPVNLPAKALFIGLTLLGATTAAFVDWPQRRLWLLFGGIVIIATIILDIYLPVQAINIPYTRYTISYSDLVTTITWLFLSGTIVIRTWRDFRRTTFPWHANRLLFWLILLLLTFTGEALLFFNYTGLTFAGQIIRFLGVFGLTYAVSSHRIIDVRTQSQSALAFILITIISALPLAGSILLVQNLTQDQPFAFVYMLITVVLGFIFYAPFRRIIEKSFQKLLVGEGVDTSQVLRHYSQNIYQILDVQQLSRVIIGTLSDLLDVQRGALMLISHNQDGYAIEPIPALGAINRQKTQLPTKSLFIKALSQLHQPLLQYELDFNRDYAGLDTAVRSWLNEMAMDVYVPVIATNNLEGVIAVGPKRSGVPYQSRELELMQILADQTVVALQNARLYSELGQQNEKIRRLNLDLTGQNERLEIMDRVKSDFITIASHELRTPLTQVKGYTDILNSMNEESDLSREQTREIVSHIIRAGDRLDVLITAMLDASQLDTEGFRMVFMETKLEMIIRMAVEPLSHALKERHISWKTKGLDDLPPLHADFKRLVQAFTNLIGNSIKYTPDHGLVSLEAELVPSHDEKEEFIEIILADQGIGIDPRYHDLIFEKFFRIGDTQLHSTGSTKFKGAGPGLGLPIAKGVIEGHGGKIWVESAGEDEQLLPGSQFHIILPLRPPDMEASNKAILGGRPDFLIG